MGLLSAVRGQSPRPQASKMTTFDAVHPVHLWEYIANTEDLARATLHRADQPRDVGAVHGVFER